MVNLLGEIRLVAKGEEVYRSWKRAPTAF